jgi:hypothetical protein
MGKHKFEVALSFGTKRMKFKIKDTYVEIQFAILDQIHFLTCVYITMWAAKKEDHMRMIEAKLDNFCLLDYNIVDLLIVTEIICGF